MSLRCLRALPEASYENQILFGLDKGFATGELVIFRLRKRAILAYCISTYGQSIDGFWLENRAAIMSAQKRNITLKPALFITVSCFVMKKWILSVSLL